MKAIMVNRRLEDVWVHAYLKNKPQCFWRIYS